jgi:phosphatidylglycerol:prolipoprotein diacylglycerol transferase
MSEFFNFRTGGMSIIGAVIGGAIGLSVYLLIKKPKEPLLYFDTLVVVLILAQAIGRWGNYFNSEAHGGPTDLPWAITVNGQSVHPTFLYESIWCLLLFILLIYVDNRRKFEGQTFLLYGILYSVERFFVESLRTDSLMIGPFKQAQVISLVIILVCVIGYVILDKKRKRA